MHILFLLFWFTVVAWRLCCTFGKVLKVKSRWFDGNNHQKRVKELLWIYLSLKNLITFSTSSRFVAYIAVVKRYVASLEKGV